uniref:Ig-like domain-containing protein n=1 Tax=Dicentrarchus labrax TaxID=13489 RepID=A0A8C4FEU4_DICLA
MFVLSLFPSVKPNTLRVSPQTPPSFVLEGSDITLPCKVTQELTHNTYLSITWLVKKGATPEEILTFGPQLDVVVGQKFAWRFANGGIRLVPVSYGLYELVISRVNSSDEGVYACNGSFPSSSNTNILTLRSMHRAFRVGRRNQTEDFHPGGQGLCPV